MLQNRKLKNMLKKSLYLVKNSTPLYYYQTVKGKLLKVIKSLLLKSPINTTTTG